MKDVGSATFLDVLTLFSQCEQEKQEYQLALSQAVMRAGDAHARLHEFLLGGSTTGSVLHDYVLSACGTNARDMLTCVNRFSVSLEKAVGQWVLVAYHEPQHSAGTERSLIGRQLRFVAFPIPLQALVAERRDAQFMCYIPTPLGVLRLCGGVLTVDTDVREAPVHFMRHNERTEPRVIFLGGLTNPSSPHSYDAWQDRYVGNDAVQKFLKEHFPFISLDTFSSTLGVLEEH